MQPELRTENNQKEAGIPKEISVYMRIANALFRRPFMKLGALLLAVFFWAIVIASDPALTIEKTVTGTASVTGLEALRNRGLIVTTDLTSEPVTVKMRIEVRQGNYDLATAESFTPRIDLAQQVTTVGTQTVKFTAPASSLGRVLSFEPESIEIDVEPFTPRRVVPVVVEQVGESGEPLWAGNPRFDPQRIIVSGPQSVVDRVTRAVVVLDHKYLSATRPNDSITARFELQDDGGRPVLSPFITATSDSVAIDSVTIDIDVYPTREIPVSIDTAVVGIPAHGYALSGVRVEPNTVTVAAAQEILDALDMLNLAAQVDVTGAYKTVIESAGLLGLSNLRYVSATEVVVEAIITPAAHVHTYNGIKIAIMGVAPGLSALPERSQMRCVVRGNYEAVEGLKVDDIHLFVDASGLGEGVHTLDVQCQIDGMEEYQAELQYPAMNVTLARR